MSCRDWGCTGPTLGQQSQSSCHVLPCHLISKCCCCTSDIACCSMGAACPQACWVTQDPRSLTCLQKFHGVAANTQVGHEGSSESHYPMLQKTCGCCDCICCCVCLQQSASKSQYRPNLHSQAACLKEAGTQRSPVEPAPLLRVQLCDAHEMLGCMVHASLGAPGAVRTWRGCRCAS